MIWFMPGTNRTRDEAATRAALGDDDFAAARRRGATATMLAAPEVAAPVLG